MIGTFVYRLTLSIMSSLFRANVASSLLSYARRLLYNKTRSGSIVVSSTPSGIALSVGLRLLRFASSLACTCACCCCAICAWVKGTDGWGPADIMGPGGVVVAEHVSKGARKKFDWGPRQGTKMLTYPAPPLVPRLALPLGCLGMLAVLALHYVVRRAQPFVETIVAASGAEANFCETIVCWWWLGRKCGRAISWN